METISVQSRFRTDFLDITAQVRRTVAAAGIREGICLVSSPHTTAGITVQEHADPDVVQDLGERLETLAPEGTGWHHSEGNADSHVKTALIGHSQSLPVSEGELVLGTWQGIFLCEFDGPRRRRVHVQVVGR
jgi:secondary thiamine-phosphate synthase enzyme